ncbi:MAG TPA: ABC transporter permease [Bryobacterales bacterium]|nr:ABC transporter permease [Bryobacterales bacterium]
MGIFNDLIVDLRYTRSLFRNNLGFSLVAVGSIALGIGASSAIFSLVHAVLFDPYPYKDAERIVRPSTTSDHGSRTMSYTVDEAIELQENSESFEDFFQADGRRGVATDGLAERVEGLAISPNFFDFMGVPAMLGRTFSPADIPSQAAPPNIAVISYLCWQRRYGADPEVVGKTIELDYQLYTILGVVPPRFAWEDADVYVPLAMVRGNPTEYTTYARIKAGVPPETAAAELQIFTERFVKRNPTTYDGRERFGAMEKMTFRPVNDWMVDFQGTLLILLGAVGFLLLIACANVSILLLSRASGRQKEIAVRRALGASRGRVIRQLLTESVVLAVCGGVIGVVLAHWGVPAIVALMPPSSIPSEAVIAVNGVVLLFSFAVAVLTGVLFGMAPALQLAKPDVKEAMEEGGRSNTGSSRLGRLRGMLVVAEVALTVVLLVGAGIAVRGLAALIQTPLGYDPSNVVRLEASIMPGQYGTWQERHNYFQRLLESLRAAPGIESATIAWLAIPPRIDFHLPFDTNGHAEPDPNRTTLVGVVGTDYFSTVGIPLLRGRDFSEADMDPIRVALINEEMERQYFADVDPIGQQIRIPVATEMGDGTGLLVAPDEEFEIIGVVASSRNSGLIYPSKPATYLPHGVILGGSQSFLVRTTGEPHAMINTLRQQLLAVNADQPNTFVQTLEKKLEEFRVHPRFTTVLFSVFAAVGLLLAASGIFSVVSYTATRRVQEFGIRRALGATDSDILSLVIGTTAKLLVIGLVIGIGGVLALSSVIQSYVQGWDPRDPVAFATVIALLLFVALVACWIPARRAAAIQPVQALREE